MKRTTLGALVFGTGTLLLAACGRDNSPGPVGNDAQRITLSVSSNDDALVLDPRTATLHVGYGIIVSARITGPDGQQVAGARPSWRSTNAAVATVTTLPDSGFAIDGARAAIVGRTVGTAMIIASYGASADTARITVAPARTDSAGTPSPNPRPSASPRTFEAGLYVSTAIDTTLLANWRREPVPNATVRLVQLPLVAGDSLPVDFPRVLVPTPIETRTTDAEGYVSFQNVPMSRFRIEVTPPAGSGWQAWTAVYGPPYVSSLRFEIRLARN